MSHRSSGDRRDEELFEKAMRGVERVESPSRASLRRRRPTEVPVRDAGRSVRFRIETWGERIEGLAPGVSDSVLARLSRGSIPVGRRLDLHGTTRDQARQRLRRVLAGAVAAEVECVLVVHGRGRRSEGPPVLKRALPEWLAEPGVGESVVAFVTAPPNLGGAGATLVLLRQGEAPGPPSPGR